MRRAWKFLELVLTVAGSVWLLYYLYQHRAQLFTALDQPVGLLLLIGCTVLATWAISSVQSVVLLRSQDVQMGQGESFLLMLSTSLLNLIPMRIGTLLRLRYNRSVHGLAYSRNVGLILLRLILVTWVSALLALVGLFGLWLGGTEPGAKVVLILMGGLFLSVVLFFMPLPLAGERTGAIRQFWSGLWTAIAMARQRQELVGILLCLLIVQLAILTYRMHLAFVVIGTPIGWPVLLIVAPLVFLVNQLSFASLGIREALVGGVIAITGSDFAVGVLAASVERGVLIGLSFSLGSVATVFVVRRIRAAERLQQSAALRNDHVARSPIP